MVAASLSVPCARPAVTFTTAARHQRCSRLTAARPQQQRPRQRSGLLVAAAAGPPADLKVEDLPIDADFGSGA